MNKYIVMLFLAAAVTTFMAYANMDLSAAQNATDSNMTVQNQTSGPIAGLSGQAQDVFNGTNQTSGPISQFGDELQETF